MAAGENTLNALCARVVLRGISANGGRYDPGLFLKDYVTYMTTPGTHNDTYAESFHRDFFKNWASGVPPEQCAKVVHHRPANQYCHGLATGASHMALSHKWSCIQTQYIMHSRMQCDRLQGTEGHNTAQIGGFVMLPPVIMAAVKHGQQAVVDSALTHLKLTHESRKLWSYAERYASLLYRLVQVRVVYGISREQGVPTQCKHDAVHANLSPAVTVLL